MSNKLLLVIFVIVALFATLAVCSTKDPQAVGGARVLDVHEDVATLEEMGALEEETLLAHIQSQASEDQASVLYARSVKSKRNLDASVEATIAKRLIPYVRGAPKNCSFSCDHKQAEFLGCSCKTTVTFQTNLQKCPTDVTTVSSTDIQWAWNQCAVQLKKNCNCQTLELTIRQHRAVVASTLIKANPAGFNSNDKVLKQVVNDVFTSKALGFVTDDFKTNTRRYVADVVDDFSRTRRYSARVKKLKAQTKRMTKAASDLTANIAKLYSAEADSRVNAVVNAAKQFTALQQDAQGKFGQTAPEVVNTVQKYESLVAKQAKSGTPAGSVAQNPLVRDLIRSLKLERKIARAAFKTSSDEKVKAAAQATITRTSKHIKQLKTPKCKKNGKKNSKKGKKNGKKSRKGAKKRGGKKLGGKKNRTAKKIRTTAKKVAAVAGKRK